jgi:hypothetical protein
MKVPVSGVSTAYQPGHSNKNKVFFTLFFIFFILSSLVFYLQQTDFEWSANRGLVVPDSVNMAETIDVLLSNGDFLTGSSSFVGVEVLYGWTWFLHPAFCFVLNSALMLASASLFKKSFIIDLKLPAWAVLGLLANPYLILVMPGPNKEIPLVFLTLCLANALLRHKPWWLISLALCVPVYFLRDGYGLIMFFIVCLLRVMRSRKQLLPLAVLILSTVVAMLYEPLADFIPALARNQKIYVELSGNQELVGSLASSLGLQHLGPIGSIFLYLSRLIYNLLTLAFFPVLKTDEGHIYWLGLAYWGFGLIALMSWFSCVLEWLCKCSGSNRVQLASSIALCVWFLISLTLFVQPRYLMPMLPLSFVVMASLNPKIRNRCILVALGLSFLCIAAYALIGNSTPLVVPGVFRTPPYVY